MNSARRGELLRAALRIFGYQIAFGFFGLMFAPLLMGVSAAIRVPLISLLIAAAGFLMFMDGAYRGERDSALGETLGKLAQKGDYAPTAAELAKRYRRVKGISAALLGVFPVLLLAGFVAVTAVPYAYAQQDLPGWLSVYMRRAEIGNALRYLEGMKATASLTDYARVGVRFVLFPYVGLLGTLSDEGSLLLDRLSPAITLILPGMTAIGYQFGPNRRAKAVKAMEEAKNRPRRRLKKAARQRLQPEKKQIV